MHIIYGMNPVREILRQKTGRIKEIVIAVGRTGNALRDILSMASKKNIPVTFKDRLYLENVAGCNSHQGIIAFCEAYAYVNIEDLLADRSETHRTILILDGVNDPQNLGALIRTAHCLGVKGVIIPENRAASVTATVIKASAGTAYLIPLVREVNLSRAIDYLKEQGFWIYGTDADNGLNIAEFNDNGPVVLVMGSEGRGLRPLIRKKCDFLLSVPMAGMVGSLNVSVAAGIILYEILKKQERRK